MLDTLFRSQFHSQSGYRISYPEQMAALYYCTYDVAWVVLFTWSGSVRDPYLRIDLEIGIRKGYTEQLQLISYTPPKLPRISGLKNVGSLRNWVNLYYHTGSYLCMGMSSDACEIPRYSDTLKRLFREIKRVNLHRRFPYQSLRPLYERMALQLKHEGLESKHEDCGSAR
jgi:hypothetical protein